MPLAQDFTVFQTEVWSDYVSKRFRKKLTAAKFFLNLSGDAAPGAKTVDTPHIGESFTASDIQTTSGDVAATNVSDTKTQLTIDKWKGAALVISDYQAATVASKYNIARRYADEIADELAETFDAAILAEGANLTPSVGDSGTAITAATIENAIRIMESYSVPRNELLLILHPNAYWKEVMAVQKFYDASQFGREVVPEGALDLLYGIPAVVTPAVPAGTAGTEGGHRNLLVHKNAICYAIGNKTPGGPRIQEKSTESLRVKIIGDIMYGVTTIESNWGVRVISKN